MLYLLCVGRQVVPCSTCSLCLQVVISALNYIKIEYQYSLEIMITGIICGHSSILGMPRRLVGSNPTEGKPWLPNNTIN